jgi:hypothetical protein
MKTQLSAAPVVRDRAYWHPRFTIKRFENPEAVRAFKRALLIEAKALFKADPKWRDWVSKLAVAQRQPIEAVAMACVPHTLQCEIARRIAFQLSDFDGNLLLNDGIDDIMWTLICGGAGTAMSNANAYLGVGDSDTAAAAAQTDLQAAVNKIRVGMEDGYPTYGSSQKATFQSSFDGDTANYTWAEFITTNHASAATALNRKVSAQGTKTSGQVWVLTEEITLS